MNQALARQQVMFTARVTQILVQQITHKGCVVLGTLRQAFNERIDTLEF